MSCITTSYAFPQTDVPGAGAEELPVPAAGVPVPVQRAHAVRVAERRPAARAAALRAHALQQEAVLAQHGRSGSLLYYHIILRYLRQTEKKKRTLITRNDNSEMGSKLANGSPDIKQLSRPRTTASLQH